MQFPSVCPTLVAVNSEFFPVHDVEIGNELFYYVFRVDPEPSNGFIGLADENPGLGLEIAEDALGDFAVIE